MQNFKTYTVGLNQRQVERVRTFPHYDAPRPGLFAGRGYRVVDVVLQDGTVHEGLLVVQDDDLLVPEWVARFEDIDIAELRATPSDRHPDFAITDPESVRERDAIEHGNLVRLQMFGPEEPERDWQSVPLDEAHAEALEDDDKIQAFDGEIPACFHGPTLLALVPGGVRIGLAPASTEPGGQRTLRPKTAAVWRALLDQTFEIDPAFTLGEMIELLDLPPEVDAELFLRTMPAWKEPFSFQPWVEAARAPGIQPDEKMDWLEVVAGADVDDEGVFTFYFNADGMGVPLEADTPESGYHKGERIRWSIAWNGPARWRHVPLRYDPELVFPLQHEDVMAFLRGPRRDWEVSGRAGAEPPMPVAFRAQRSITLGEFIGALFSELTPRNAEA